MIAVDSSIKKAQSLSYEREEDEAQVAAKLLSLILSLWSLYGVTDKNVTFDR